MFKLVISDDEGKTTVVPLSRDELSIGRKEGNAVRLTERNVSRKHARIAKRDGKYTIEDMRSYMGTRVNGRRLDAPHVLEPGDQIGIGDYVVLYEQEGRETGSVEVEIDSEPQIPARVVMLVGPAPGAEYALSRLPVRIGRSEELDVHVNHRSISREHAEFAEVDGALVVRDLKSANGVRVNGEDIEECGLEDGDIIDLGQVKFRFVGPGVEYTFDPADATRAMEEDSQSGSRAPTFAAVAIIGIAVIVSAAIAASMSGKSRRDADEVARVSAERTAEELREALAGCRRAVSGARWDEAVQLADRALAIDGQSADVHACRAEAAAGADGQGKFDRGKTALTAGRIDEAYFAFAELAEDSPLRTRPEIAQARQLYVSRHLAAARAAVATDPATSAREARFVLAVMDLAEADRLEAERLAGGTVEAPPPSAPDAAVAQAPEPTPEPAPTPAPATGADAGISPIEQARACQREGNHRCVIDTLEGRVASAPALVLLVSAYSQIGDRASARRAATAFVDRFPNDPRAERYRVQWLGYPPSPAP